MNEHQLLENCPFSHVLGAMSRGTYHIVLWLLYSFIVDNVDS